MGRQKHREQDSLEVTIMYEPTRLAMDHLMEAYRQVVPLQGQGRKMGRELLGEVATEPQAPPSVMRRSPS
jgi:hypothetical protein